MTATLIQGKKIIKPVAGTTHTAESPVSWLPAAPSTAASGCWEAQLKEGRRSESV